MTAFGAALRQQATLSQARRFFGRNSKAVLGVWRAWYMRYQANHQALVKVDYTDKQWWKDHRSHFTIFDNTFLNQEYVDNLIATTPSGMFLPSAGYAGAGWSVKVLRYIVTLKRICTAQPPENFAKIYAGLTGRYEHWGSIVVDRPDWGQRYYYILGKISAHQYKGIDFWVDIAKDIKSALYWYILLGW